MITRKRKASIVSEQNQETEIKRPTIDYIKQLDGNNNFILFFKIQIIHSP
jgi:hypothetical protein